MPYTSYLSVVEADVRSHRNSLCEGPCSELLHDLMTVNLYCALRYAKRVGDLLVEMATDNKPKHFSFAGT